VWSQRTAMPVPPLVGVNDVINGRFGVGAQFSDNGPLAPFGQTGLAAKVFAVGGRGLNQQHSGISFRSSTGERVLENGRLNLADGEGSEKVAAEIIFHLLAAGFDFFRAVLRRVQKTHEREVHAQPAHGARPHASVEFKAPKNIALDELLAEALLEKHENQTDREADNEVTQDAIAGQAEQRLPIHHVSQQMIGVRAHHDDGDPLHGVQQFLGQTTFSPADDADAHHEQGEKIDPTDGQGAEGPRDGVQSIFDPVHKR